MWHSAQYYTGGRDAFSAVLMANPHTKAIASTTNTSYLTPTTLFDQGYIKRRTDTREREAKNALGSSTSSRALPIFYLLLQRPDTLVANVREKQQRRKKAADEPPHVRLM